MSCRKSLQKLALVALAIASHRSTTAAPTSKATLIDSTGTLNKAIPSLPPNTGVVALIASPGTASPFDQTDGAVRTNEVLLSSAADGVLITCPGASLESSSLISRGAGAAAVGSLATSVIIAGVTASDVETGLPSTRHGRTLSELFAAAIRLGKQSSARSLLVAVQAPAQKSDDDGFIPDKTKVKADVEEIFNSVAAAACVEDSLADHFKVEVTLVKGPEDASKIMKDALSAASTTSILPGKSFSSEFSSIYNNIVNSQTCDPTPVAEAILACNDAYSRASRMSRARIATWKHRASRGLVVPKFGSGASSLLKNTLDLFDRDTMAAAGLPYAAERRLEIRTQLQERTEKMLRELYALQMAILEKSTLKKFNNALLRKLGTGDNNEDFYENNAAVLRDALFAFDMAVSTLEVSSLALTKSKPVQAMQDKLNSALMSFTDSPAAKIKSMGKVERAVSKQKKPTEGSIDVSLDFVAMIRPDGFGNLQGFAGYQLGPHSVTVGVHNDADDPQVISSFGGVRPPFIRVQPKLKVDVEL